MWAVFFPGCGTLLLKSRGRAEATREACRGLEQKISGAQQVGGKMSRKASEGVWWEPVFLVLFFFLHQGRKVRSFQEQTADLLHLNWHAGVNTLLQGCGFKVFSSAGVVILSTTPTLADNGDIDIPREFCSKSFTPHLKGFFTSENSCCA